MTELLCYDLTSVPVRARPAAARPGPAARPA